MGISFHDHLTIYAKGYFLNKKIHNNFNNNKQSSSGPYAFVYDSYRFSFIVVNSPQDGPIFIFTGVGTMSFIAFSISIRII